MNIRPQSLLAKESMNDNTEPEDRKLQLPGVPVRLCLYPPLSQGVEVMATQVWLLRHGPYVLPEGGDPALWGESISPDYERFVGCPSYGPDKHNLDKARTFKTEANAKATNEFKYWGYIPVKALVTVELMT